MAARKILANAKEPLFREAWVAAVAAGRAAGNGIRPTPMVVTEHANPMDDNSRAERSWYVSEGACGFAWVTVRPGNSAFANWLKKNGYARPAYGGGVQIWISDYNQSVDRKEAHASAMAKVLREKLGIDSIYADSRLD